MWVSVTIAGFRSPLLLEVAVGLPLNRFGDHRCFSSAVLSSFRVIVVVEKASGAEVLVVVDSGQDERSQLTSLGCGFNMSRGVKNSQETGIPAGTAPNGGIDDGEFFPWGWGWGAKFSRDRRGTRAGIPAPIPEIPQIFEVT
ncbi:uncharacterized protein LOC127739768 isoform X3 [Arachis duranensis]|uniref:Uncharacterized protein LOC127739768 isoform X3 n=1 Tax=Arachis duranensis TaxID=130453 RepID=A0A9C6TBM2_ARADU|nr:uncharacterized protein LOC127739768 isoform X3 [Arachis duranensis]